MNTYDVFISHQHDDADLCRAIAVSLENQGLKCWYAPRDITGSYARAIVDAIENSKVFLLLLNKKSAKSSHVLNEVELAHSLLGLEKAPVIQPVFTQPFDINDREFREIMYYIRRINFLPVRDYSAQSISQALIDTYRDKFGLSIDQDNLEREITTFIPGEAESKRLSLQDQLTRKFDDWLYSNIFEKFPSLSVLDLGCRNGQMMISRMEGRVDSLQWIGVDNDPTHMYCPISPHEKWKMHFLYKDVESEDFLEVLKAEMKMMKIESFDLINISMLLLLLKNPEILLEGIRPLLSDNGVLVIKDIDDGANIIYPDENHYFERAISICSKCETSGFRRSGRQIPYFLENAGYHNIQLKRQGFSTSGLDQQQKNTFFDMYFGFILDDIQWMAEHHPDNLEYQDDFQWYQSHMEDLRRDFCKSSTFFSLGFMLFSAEK